MERDKSAWGIYVPRNLGKGVMQRTWYLQWCSPGRWSSQASGPAGWAGLVRSHLDLFGEPEPGKGSPKILLAGVGWTTTLQYMGSYHRTLFNFQGYSQPLKCLREHKIRHPALIVCNTNRTHGLGREVGWISATLHLQAGNPYTGHNLHSCSWWPWQRWPQCPMDRCRRRSLGSQRILEARQRTWIGGHASLKLCVHIPSSSIQLLNHEYAQLPHCENNSIYFLRCCQHQMWQCGTCTCHHG